MPFLLVSKLYLWFDINKPLKQKPELRNQQKVATFLLEGRIFALYEI